MASPAPPSPSDNRFALVTPDDHQAYVYIAAILSLIWSSITLVIKLFTKWGCYGADDALTTVAQVSTSPMLGIKATYLLILIR